MLPAHTRKETDAGVLRLEWKDAVPFRLREKFDGLTSEWDLENSEHQARLVQLMHQWVIADKEQQREVEDRLRFLHVAPRKTEPTKEGTGDRGSYLAAVRPETPPAATQLTTEQVRLRELCMKPVSPTSKLRARTADETTAVLMLLNHEIEVPSVPPFLSQSMSPGEMAVFEDLFKALEYPIYAHVAPGQRFFNNMTTSAILAQIHCGSEAAPPHKQQIEAFKRELSRISLDMRTRVLKVTFKGRVTAAKWVGWQLPLASRLITLIDYEMIRERAKRTHELVMLDYYSFEVEVRKGSCTSRDMYWLLKEGLGLNLQAMTHTASASTGIIETQWQVRVHASECPSCIEDKSYIAMGQVEVVIHHAETHVNWPCRNCLSPVHLARLCSVEAESVELERSKHTCTVQGTPPSARGNIRLGVGDEGQLRTMAQLEKLLRTEGRDRPTGAGVASTAQVMSLGRTRVETSSGMMPPKLKPCLPAEWGTSRSKEDKRAAISTEQDEHPLTAQLKQNGPDEKRSQYATAQSQRESRLGLTGEGTFNAAQVKSTKRASDAASKLQKPVTSEPSIPAEVGVNKAEGDPKPVKMNDIEEKQQAGPSCGAAYYELSSPCRDAQVQHDSGPEIECGGEDVDQEMEMVEEKRPIPEEYAAACKLAKRRQRETLTTKKESARGRSLTTRRLQQGTGFRSKIKFGVRAVNGACSRGLPREGERRASHSPKRRAARLWVSGRATDASLDGNDGMPEGIADVKARSLSPKRLSLERTGQGSTQKLQQFMHQFMVAVTGKTAKEVEEVQGSEFGSEEGEEDPGFSLVAVTDPTDEGAPLAEWLEKLRGDVVDVAANGNCGWLAFFSALYNEAEGLDRPTTSVTAKANLLKKRVINEMIANLAEEARLHPEVMRAEAVALGCHEEEKMTTAARLCAISNHLAEQRIKSVKAHVPMHYWVRPMHLKAMATHARKTIYVLDVAENDRARIQEYAYHEIQDQQGDIVETGTVSPITTRHAMAMFSDMVTAGIRPPVLILRWSAMGNHFQAVHYKQDEYDHYAQNIVDLAEVRNSILVNHGWEALDSIGYDLAKTAKAAAGALAKLRKHAKAEKSTARVQIQETSPHRQPRTISMEVLALQKREEADCAEMLLAKWTRPWMEEPPLRQG